jgi:hypothetical protein
MKGTDPMNWKTGLLEAYSDATRTTFDRRGLVVVRPTASAPTGSGR